MNDLRETDLKWLVTIVEVWLQPEDEVGMEQGECNPAKAGIPLNHRDLSVPAAATLQPPSGPIHQQYSCLETSRKLSLVLQTDSKKTATAMLWLSTGTLKP